MTLQGRGFRTTTTGSNKVVTLTTPRGRVRDPDSDTWPITPDDPLVKILKAVKRRTAAGEVRACVIRGEEGRKCGTIMKTEMRSPSPARGPRLLLM